MQQLQAVRLESAAWAADLHATAHHPRRAAAEAVRAATASLEWAAGAPTALGGDFNLRELELGGLHHAAGHDVDHIFGVGLEPVGRGRTLDSGTLSDHVPVFARFRPR